MYRVEVKRLAVESDYLNSNPGSTLVSCAVKLVATSEGLSIVPGYKK